MPTPRLETDAERLQQRNRELSILNDIAQSLNEQVDLDQALHTTLAKVADLLGLQTGWVWLLHEETGESYLAAHQNLPPALADHPRRMGGSCYCLDTFRAGDLEGAANVNVITCSRLQWLSGGTRGLKYHASIPLYAHGSRSADGQKLGVLNVANTDWLELSPQDLQLLSTIGDMLSIAVERARLFAHSSQMGAVEERNRLAREIHDTLAQGLAAVALHLETADALLQSGEDMGQEPARRLLQTRLQQALDLTRLNLEEARRSVLDLRLAHLEGRSLVEALGRLAQEYASRQDFQVEYEAGSAGHPLPARVEAGLYRIAQEALENAARHAGARRVTIRLSTTPSEVRLVVGDDGQGFDPDHVPTGRFGLIGLNERARFLGGRLVLESAPNAGTRLEVIVPLAARRRAARGDRHNEMEASHG
jgi:two-component system NarL family sensor kinase